jgi:hypothetical protein
MRCRDISIAVAEANATVKLETGLERQQLVLEIPQLRRRHHFDVGDFLNLNEA